RPRFQIQALGNDLIMDARMLNDVQRRQMKSKCAHPPYEPAHQEVSGMASAVREQTLGGQSDVEQQFLGTLIRIGPTLVACLEALTDLAEKHAVGHAIVPRRRQRLRPRQQCRVSLDALGQGSAYADAMGAL